MSLFLLARYDIMLYCLYSESNAIFLQFLMPIIESVVIKKNLNRFARSQRLILLVRYDIMLSFSIMNPMIFFAIFLWLSIERFFKELHAIRSFVITFCARSL